MPGISDLNWKFFYAKLQATLLKSFLYNTKSNLHIKKLTNDCPKKNLLELLRSISGFFVEGVLGTMEKLEEEWILLLFPTKQLSKPTSSACPFSPAVWALSLGWASLKLSESFSWLWELLVLLTTHEEAAAQLDVVPSAKEVDDCSFTQNYNETIYSLLYNPLQGYFY